MSTIVCSWLEARIWLKREETLEFQRRERGEATECADDLGPSRISTASHGPLGRWREIHFGLTESRSQNRSPVDESRNGESEIEA